MGLEVMRHLRERLSIIIFFNFQIHLYSIVWKFIHISFHFFQKASYRSL